jgi:hypothetical protein
LNAKELNVDISKLLSLGISIEMYFIINCIYYEHRDVLEKYVLKCNKIDISTFNKLVEIGYLEPINGGFLFGNLKLTDKCIKSFNFKTELDHKAFFNELKSTYPSMFKVNNKVVRRFHQDLPSCRRKYKEIVTSKEKHDLIIKCVKLYIKEQKDSGKMEFTQMLSSFLNQSNYEMYMDEAKLITDETDVLSNNLDNKTSIGSDKF